jgi:hypothetical protein
MAGRKRGRPPLPVGIKIVRALMGGLTGVNAMLDAMLEGRVGEIRRRNPKGGRPADLAFNKELLEVVKDAERRGVTLRACLEEFIERKLGRPAELEDVARCRRQIDRLRRHLITGRA